MGPPNTVLEPKALAGATLFALVVFAVGATAGGCAFDWGFPSESAPDGGGGADQAADSVPPPDGAGQDVITVDVSPPPPQGCKNSASCGGGYCLFPDHACGAASVAGKCTPIDTNCVGVAWVCGCSGVAQKNVCEAAKALEDVSDTAACAAPPQTFRCGTRFCDDLKSFCVVNKKGPIPEYDCVDLAGCGAGDCSCPAVKNLMCASCTGTGQVTVTCP